jgi:hypothetical protein
MGVLRETEGRASAKGEGKRKGEEVWDRGNNGMGGMIIIAR